MRSVIALIALAALAGCATTVPSLSEQRPVDKTRAAVPTPTAVTPASVRVTRDVGYIGAAVNMHISLDGKRIASLEPGEFVEFKVDPGSYLLSAIPTDIFNGRHPTIVEASWKAGEAYRYRVGFDANAAVNLMRSLPGEVTPPDPYVMPRHLCGYAPGMPCK